MNFLISLVLVCLLSSTLGNTIDQTRAYLQTLQERSYDKYIPPEGFHGEGSPVIVKASAFFMDIHTIDDSNLDLNAHFYFRQSWNDSRLKHNINVDGIILNSADSIWTPDLFFVEERKGSLHKIIQPNTYIRIKPNGEVSFSSKLSVKFHCPMDLRNYPHDIQKCPLSIESYGFQRKHIELDWLSGSYKPVTFFENMAILEYNLIDAETSSAIAELSTGIYTRLTINLILKRKFGFFAIRLYIPFIILILMTSLSFWIRAEERSLRLALLLVVLYLMVTASTSMNNLTPYAPYIKGSDIWIGSCSALVFAAFLEFIVIALLDSKESKDNSLKIESEDLLNMALEDKGNKLKSATNKLINMFGARQGGMRNSLSLRIDKICRVLFPVIFVIFNIIYWCMYCLA